MERKFLVLFLVLSLFGFEAVNSASQNPDPDLSIQWVRYITGETISSVQYDPSAPLRLPIKIAVKFENASYSECATSLGIKGIQTGPTVSVTPPIPIPKPDRSGLSYIETFFTIPSGLQYGTYSFEVRIIPNRNCNDVNPSNDVLVVSIRLVGSSQGAERSDYAIESVTLADGKNPAEGVLYSPDFPSPCSIKVRVKWNNINPTKGILCDNNRLQVWGIGQGDRILLVPPLKLSKADTNGISENVLSFNLPQGKTEGSIYPIKIEFLPSDRDCDSNQANNSNIVNIKLLRQSGNDLTVKIIKIESVYNSSTRKWNPKVTFDVANISGTETLFNVRILIDYNYLSGRPGGYDNYTCYLHTLPPKKWIRKTEQIDQEITKEGEIFVRVDPYNDIREVREDNNIDRKFFRQ